MKKTLLSLMMLLTITFFVQAQQFNSHIFKELKDENISIKSRSIISENDILYWVGQGDNSAILIVNWCNPEIALAWGYRWDDNEGTIYVEDMMNDIMSEDRRFAFNASSGFVNDITYYDSSENRNLSLYGMYFMYNVNGGFASGFSNQELNNGDIVEWGDETCGTFDDDYNYQWNITVTPVQNPNGCAAPTNLLAAVEINAAVLSWDGDAASYLLSYSDSNQIYNSFIVNVNSCELSDLAYNTNWTWSVRAICGEGDTSEVVFGENFRTPIPEDISIDPEDIRYWIGEGDNEMVFIVNWCAPEIAFAWGYRFETEYVTVKNIMDDIMDMDSRFSYELGMYGVDDISFQDSTYSLSLSTPSSFWMYNINGGLAMEGFTDQQVVDGDVIKWGDASCAYTDPDYNMSWTTEITPVSTPIESGVKEFDHVRLTISPNPATDYIKINYTGECAHCSVSIIDISGRLVGMEEMSNSNTTISVSNLKNGIYFIRVENGRYSKVEKIIIAK